MLPTAASKSPKASATRTPFERKKSSSGRARQTRRQGWDGRSKIPRYQLYERQRKSSAGRSVGKSQTQTKARTPALQQGEKPADERAADIVTKNPRMLADALVNTAALNS